MKRSVVALQAVYYLLTGLWAVAHRRSFEAVSGRKHDYWLVRTVGMLAAVIGSALLVATRRGEPSPEARALAVGAGAGFSTVDLVYVVRRRISPVYLADVAVHLALATVAAMPILRRATKRARPVQVRSPV